jgi:hypothetical protein
LEATYKALDDPTPPMFYDGITLKCIFADAKNTLFIVNIPIHFSEEEAHHDLVLQTKIPIPRFVLGKHPDGRSKGHGWATYPSHTIASQALTLINGLSINSCVLSAQFAFPRAFDPRQINSVRSLFVKGLALDTNRNSLSKYIVSLLPETAQWCFKTVSIPTDTKRYYIIVIIVVINIYIY